MPTAPAPPGRNWPSAWEVLAVHPGDGFEVVTPAGTIRTQHLVSGGSLGGADRRHGRGRGLACGSAATFFGATLPTLPASPGPGGPTVRSTSARESGGLLLCPCDETEVDPPALHRQPGTDGEVLAQLYASLRELAPDLADRPIARTWCGLRSFAADRRFVLGRDPLNPLFWVAGLGGHGMTSGLAVAERAARLFLEGGEDELSPARFRASPVPAVPAPGAAHP